MLSSGFAYYPATGKHVTDSLLAFTGILKVGQQA